MVEKHGESTHRELHEALAELHEALSGDVELDAELRTELEEVSQEITQALGRGPDASAEGSRLSDMAECLALRLEVSHPVLTGVLNRVTHQLASLGI